MMTVPVNFPLSRKMRRLAARGKLHIRRESESGGLGPGAHGATHQHEDIIYDAAILRMAACLEWLIQKQHGDGVAKFNKEWVKRFCKKARAPGHIRVKMQDIVEKRGDIAHKRNREHQINFDQFSQIRRDCLAVDEWAREKLNLDAGIRDVMVSHSLPYLMGNAGDVIKHGALAELVAWRLVSRPGEPLRYADPFGGRPWGRPLCAKIPERIQSVSPDCALRDAQPHPDWRIYGSAHVVRNVAHAVENVARAVDGDARVDVRVFASDSDKLARSDLEASGLQLLRERGGYLSKDGYSILNLAGEFDLILIDPFSNFLRDEFWKNDGKHFPRMLEIVQDDKHRDLWLAVFVLNMNPRNEVGKNYAAFKRQLADYVIGLRCPKIFDSGVHGEDRFETEILLISSQVREEKISGLRKRLERFRESAQSALNPGGAGIEVIDAETI